MKKQNLKGHQGDLIFSSVSNLPKEAKKVKNQPLAYGEVSGHCHIITGDVELFEFEGRMYAVVGHDGGRIQHVHESNLTEKDYTSTRELQKADHNAHLIPEGIYSFAIQNSYNPYSKLMEKVID